MTKSDFNLWLMCVVPLWVFAYIVMGNTLVKLWTMILRGSF